jgi:hypothetical protein
VQGLSQACKQKSTARGSQVHMRTKLGCCITLVLSVAPITVLHLFSVIVKVRSSLLVGVCKKEGLVCNCVRKSRIGARRRSTFLNKTAAPPLPLFYMVSARGWRELQMDHTPGVCAPMPHMHTCNSVIIS